MPITLYHAVPTRSVLARFALEEAGLPHSLVRVDLVKGENRQPSYLARNPLGQLPALVDGEITICESAAIAIHVGEKAPDRALAPPIGDPRRPLYLHWIVFSTATQLHALSKIAQHTLFLPEGLRSSATAGEGRAQWSTIAPVIARAVAGRRWLMGDDFTMADVMVGGSLRLAQMVGALDDPALSAYFGRVADRPAFQRASAD